MQPGLFTGNFLGSFEQSFTLILFTYQADRNTGPTGQEDEVPLQEVAGELVILLKCCTLIQDFETAHGTEGGVSEVKNSAVLDTQVSLAPTHVCK